MAGFNNLCTRLLAGDQRWQTPTTLLKRSPASSLIQVLCITPPLIPPKKRSNCKTICFQANIHPNSQFLYQNGISAGNVDAILRAASHLKTLHGWRLQFKQWVEPGKRQDLARLAAII